MQLRVLYAGDMEFARKQFANSARQLTLVPINDVVGAFGGRSVAANVDVAVIDCGAPGVNAAALVAQLRSLRVSVPIVLVIDPGVENGASMALGLQADDYTVKTPGWLARLPIRLQIVVSRLRRLKQLEGSGEAEDRLRSAVERAPVCLVRVLEDGTIVAVNDAARGMLGVAAPEEVLKQPLSTFVAEQYAEGLPEFLSTVCNGESRSLEVSIVPKQGNERIMELSATTLPKDGSGRASAIVALRDLTERRRLEASVLEVAGSDAVADRAAREQLHADIADLQKRFDESLSRQQQLTEERDAERRAAETAASESARLNALLAERKAAPAADPEMERAYQEVRTQLDEASRTLEQERQQAAARLKDAAGDLQLERERREAAEQKLDAEERRLFDAVVAKDAANARLAEVSVERDAHLGRIQELERGRAESTGGDPAELAEARTARESAERRLSELDARMMAERSAAKVVGDRCASLEVEHQHLRAEIAQLTMDRHASDARAATQLNAEISRRESTDTRFGELESELSRAATQRAELEDAVARAAARVRELEDAVTRANSAHAAEMAAATAARAALARAVEERDGLRGQIDVERHRQQQSAAAMPATDSASREAIVREQSRTIEILTERLNQSETACRKASAERDEREQAFRTLQAELNQFVELRRNHRQELMAALSDAQRFEDLATRQTQKCGDLERALRAAQSEFDELTTWASARSARLNEGLK